MKYLKKLSREDKQVQQVSPMQPFFDQKNTVGKDGDNKHAPKLETSEITTRDLVLMSMNLFEMEDAGITLDPALRKEWIDKHKTTIKSNGENKQLVYGVLHSEPEDYKCEKPTVVTENEDAKIVSWYYRGQLHHRTQPARIGYAKDGTEYVRCYYLHGKEIDLSDQEHFQTIVKYLKKPKKNFRVVFEAIPNLEERKNTIRKIFDLYRKEHVEDQLFPSERSIHTYTSPMFIQLENVVHPTDELDARRELLALLREERKRVATFTNRSKILSSFSILTLLLFIFVFCLVYINLAK